MTPSVHFLVRQAARERLSATRTLSEEAKARHEAMAELYMHRAQQLQSHGENAAVEALQQPKQLRARDSDNDSRAS